MITDTAQAAAEAQKTLAESLNDFPPDYFKQLADGTKSVSEMQLSLTESTIKLIDAQGELRNALSNLPDVHSARDTTNEQQLPTDGFLKVADSSQEVQQAQYLLARSARDTSTSLREISDIPPQSQIAQKDSGLKLGFDYDTAKDIFLTGAGMAAATASTGVGLAFSPEILAGALVAAGIGGIAKGSYDETTSAREQPYDDSFKPLVEADLSGIITPLSSVDGNLQSIMQTLQDRANTTDKPDSQSELFSSLKNLDTPLTSILQSMQDGQVYKSDSLQETFGELPNIRADVQSILQSMTERGEETPVQTADAYIQDYMPQLTSIDGTVQSILQSMTAQQAQEATISFETVLMPLNNIEKLVQSVLSELNGRKPPQVNVSPTITVDLGGAYVFDNAMKRELTDDCTQQIVNEIEKAVRQATTTADYSYGA